MNNHAPGKLKAFTNYAEPEIRDESDKLFAVLHGRTAQDALRMAACWNACDGIETGELQNPLLTPLEPVTLAPARAYIGDLERQRDALLAALKAMMPSNLCLTNKNVPDSEFMPVDITMGELRAAAAAIAKVNP